MKIKKLFFLATLLISVGIYAQADRTPSEVITGNFIGKTAPLRDYPIHNPNIYSSSEITIVPQQVNVIQEENRTSSVTIIPNLQTVPGGITALPILQNFQGANQSQSGFLPPDPTGAAGPNHYVHSVNSLVKIFDKQGSRSGRLQF